MFSAKLDLGHAKVCVQRDASGIVAFPVTRSTKRKNGGIYGLLRTRPTLLHRSHAKTPHLVTQSFSKLKRTQGVRYKDRGLAQLRKIPNNFHWVCLVYGECLRSLNLFGVVEKGFWECVR